MRLVSWAVLAKTPESVLHAEEWRLREVGCGIVQKLTSETGRPVSHCQFDILEKFPTGPYISRSPELL